MTAILINLLREEMHKEQKQDREQILVEKDSPFWTDADILEIVEHILRPQQGPPSVIEDSDVVFGKHLSKFSSLINMHAMLSRVSTSISLHRFLQVLSALNLYRYILITESSGKSNKTGILSIANLGKACDERLIPLRTLVSVVTADDRISADYMWFKPCRAGALSLYRAGRRTIEVL